MTSVQEFLEHYEACEDGLNWAVANCKTMQDVWDKAKPEWLVWVATCDGVLTDKELRLFACFCARQNWHLLTDERSRNAVEVAERYANGQATGEELVTARDAAWDAAWDAATRAARDAARVAARYAAYAASVAARSGGSEAVRKEQAEYLRKNCKPHFELKGE